MDLEVLGAENDRLSKEELFKIYLAIDAELANEPANRGLSGIGAMDELQQTRSLLLSIIESDFQNEDDLNIFSHLNEPEDGVNGLKDFFKKVSDGVKNVVNKVVNSPVVQTVANVVKKAATVVHKVVTLPLKGILLLTLNTIAKGAALGFIYAFIPADSPILVKNPKVKDKREKQLKALKIIALTNAFEMDYLMKHVRNAIVKKTGKSPEQIINERQAAGIAGLGFVDWAVVAAAVAALLPAVPALVSVFGKKDIPTNGDFETPPSANDKIPDPINDDDKDESKFMSFVKSPAGIVTMIFTASGIGYAIYQVASAGSGKKRRRN